MLLQLRQFLTIAEKILDRKSDNPILHSVCLHNGLVVMTDLEITATMPVDDDRSYTLPLDILKKVLKTNPKHLEIEISKGPILKIKFDDKALKFPVAEWREYPDVPTDVFQEVGIWPAELFQQIHSQLPYTSTDSLRPAMNGILIEQNAKISSCATNGHVLHFLRDLDPENKSRLIKPHNCVISRKVVGILSKFARGMIKVNAGEKFLRFQLPGDIEITVRKTEDAFPDFRKVLDGKFPNEIKLQKKDFLKVISSGIGFAHPLNHKGVFTNTNGVLELEVTDSEMESSFHTEFPILNKKGKELKIGYDLTLLERMLKDVDGDEITWSFNGGEGPSLFTNPEDKTGQVILVMPLRLEEG